MDTRRVYFGPVYHAYLRRRPGHEEQEQRTVRNSIDQGAEQFHRSGIGPLEVFYDQKDRALFTLVLANLLHGQEELAFELFWIQMFKVQLFRRKTEQVFHYREDRFTRSAYCLEDRCDFVSGLCGAIFWREGEARPKEVDQNVIGFTPQS